MAEGYLVRTVTSRAVFCTGTGHSAVAHRNECTFQDLLTEICMTACQMQEVVPDRRSQQWIITRAGPAVRLDGEVSSPVSL
jgi:hypothetical protein